jgi:hypothetical protein
MQLHGGESVPQNQLHAFTHVALAGERLLGVIAEVGALKEPANDLAQREHTGNRAVLEPANKEALHVRLPAAHHPLREGLHVGGRRYPAAMQCTAGGVSRHDLSPVAAGGFAQVDAFAHLKGIVEIRLAHAEPSLAEPR